MSRLFLLFLIALLPLRGWSVQSMPLSMASPTAAVQGAGLVLAMGEDCALHMQQAAAALGLHAHGHDVRAASEHKSEHKGCQSCQLCMPLAALDGTKALALAVQPQTQPRVGHSHFLSAERARAVKPPIS